MPASGSVCRVASKWIPHLFCMISISPNRAVALGTQPRVINAGGEMLTVYVICSIPVYMLCSIEQS